MPENRNAPQHLTSWKEIADYLNVAVRTAQAWERTKGLPVHRMTGRKGRVSAGPEELDRWKRAASRSDRLWSKPAYLKAYIVLLAVLLIALAAYESTRFLNRSRYNPPTSSPILQQPLVVVEHSKKGTLHKSISKSNKTNAPQFTKPLSHPKIRFLDIDGDSELETILDYSPTNSHPIPNAPDPAHGKSENDHRFATSHLPTTEASAPARQ